MASRLRLHKWEKCPCLPPRVLQVGHRLQQVQVDLHSVPGFGRLEQCTDYSLTVLPAAQLLSHPRSSLLAQGASLAFSYIPGRSPPPDPALVGSTGLVRLVGGGEVELVWRPANLCVLGHRVKVTAVRHLRPEVEVPEAADPESEPVVYEVTVMEGGLREVEVVLSHNLTACVHHRVEVTLLASP